MIWTLKNVGHSESFTVDATIYALWLMKDLHPDGMPEKLQQFNFLNDEQSKAVCKFLKYMANLDNFSEAKEAISEYWCKFES